MEPDNTVSDNSPDPYQNILRKTYEKRIPFASHMELTYRCNLTCLHCYAVHRNIKNELTTEEVKECMDQLADLGTLYLTLTGGEIFTRPDIFEILEYAAVKEFAMQIFTNGTLLTAEEIKRIADLNPMSVDMSLYSMDPAVHDKITGVDGSHQKTVYSIENCVHYGIRTNIKIMLMKYNIGGYDEVEQFASNLGTELVFDYSLVPADDGSLPMDEHGLSEEDIYRFVLAHADPDFELPEPPDGSDPICGAGANTICINPQGDVFPCLAIREPIGNIRNNSIEAVWRSTSLDFLRNTRYCNLVDCAECGYIAYCSNCAGTAKAECGNIRGKSESACTIARANKRAIEELISRRR